MNGFAPVVGIEFDDNYINARKKMIDLIEAINKLTPMQREQLAKELIAATGMTATFQQFINYIQPGRQV